VPRFWYIHPLPHLHSWAVITDAATAEISSFQLSWPYFCWFQQDTNSDFQVRNIELLVPYFFHNISNQLVLMYINKKQISKCRPCNLQKMILLFQKILECCDEEDKAPEDDEQW
jgi:hypothetical protein